MSISIYNGFKVKLRDLYDFKNKFIKLSIQGIARDYVKNYDDFDNKLKNDIEFANKFNESIDKAMLSGCKYSSYGKEFVEFIAIFQQVFYNYIMVFKNGISNFTIHGSSLNIYLDKEYAYCHATNEFLDYKYFTGLCTDFSYYDKIDKPSNIEDKEWQNRRGTWCSLFWGENHNYRLGPITMKICDLLDDSAYGIDRRMFLVDKIAELVYDEVMKMDVGSMCTVKSIDVGSTLNEVFSDVYKEIRGNENGHGQKSSIKKN